VTSNRSSPLTRDPSQHIRPFSPAYRAESDREIERSCANVTMIGAERPDTKAEPDPRAEVILGVDTHTSMSTWRWPWTIWVEKPGRGQRANDR
jgi:hypothetical protein